MMMPLMDGLTMSGLLRRIDPAVCIIGASGLPAAATVAAAAAAGIGHFLAKPYTAQALLTATERDDVDVSSAETARLFATHAAIILGHAQQEDHLTQALQTRKIIGQAIGIVMERYRIDADRAFQFLIRASSTSNVKLRDVAEEVVTSSSERYRAGG